MPMSVRLDPETEALIKRTARAAGRSKSWVVREAVAAYTAAVPRGRAPYDALAPFIGAGATGLPDLSERTGERFADVVRTKTHARRSR
jgi:predicted transcriptional regulator